MNWELFWAAAASLFTGLGVAWAIFSFVIDKRDKQQELESKGFYTEFYAFQDRLEKDFIANGLRLENLMKDVVALSTTIEIQKEKFSNMTERFTDYAREVRHTLDRHSEELTELGKIIRVGRK